MQSIRPTSGRTRLTLGPLAGSCLLVLYLVAATPLAPVAFSLLAELDRSHHVAIQPTPLGLQVLLRHDCGGSLPHRHGMIARALTVFALRTPGPQSDHVIQFGSTDPAQQTPVLRMERASNLPDPEGIAAGGSVFQLAEDNVAPAAVPRPPPAVNSLQLLVRSTVLRI